MKLNANKDEIVIKFIFYIFTGILNSHSPLRTAATGFLQYCVFLNLFLIEQKYILVNLSPFWRGPQTEDGSLHTYLLALKCGALLGFSDASIPRGWKVNTGDLTDPEPSQLITSLSNLLFLFPSFSITLLLPSLFPPPSAFSFLSLKWKPDNTRSFPLQLVSEEAGDYKSEMSCCWLLICQKNRVCLSLDQGWFLT